MKSPLQLTTITKRLQQPVAETQLLCLGHFCLLGLLFLSLYYYKERMLHFDTANYAFNMLVEESFYTGFNRYISYVYQLLPLLLIKLGASLPIVLMGYSASFVLVFWLFYVIISHVFGNRIVGIWLVFALILTIRYKFYAPVGEIVNSIPLIALVLAWISRPADRFPMLPPYLDIAIGIALGSLLLIGHPFAVLSTAIVLGFHLVWNSQWKQGVFWCTAIGLGLILIYSFWPEAGTQNYQTDRAGRLDNIWALLTRPGDFYITQLMGKYWDEQYVLPSIILLILWLNIALRKRWLSLLYSTGSLTVIILIVASLHAYLNRATFLMIDGYMTHIGLVFALPLVFLWGKERYLWQFSLLVCLAVYSLHRIHAVHNFFAEREAVVQHLIDTHTSADQPKAVIDYSEDLTFNQLWMDWALPYETLLLSSLKGPTQARTIDVYYAHEDKWGAYVKDPDFFIGAVYLSYDHLGANELPKRFFQLKPSRYRLPANYQD